VDGDLSSLKIADFGLAKELSEGEFVNNFCGSPGYMAPEIYKQEPYRFEVDMFAFGVILFRLLSGGEKPFDASNDRVLRRSVERLEYNVDSSAWEDVSTSAKQFVRKLLIAKEERLIVNDAMRHEWFSITSDSVIRTIASIPHTHSNALAYVSCMMIEEYASPLSFLSNLIALLL